MKNLFKKKNNLDVDAENINTNTNVVNSDEEVIMDEVDINGNPVTADAEPEKAIKLPIRYRISLALMKFGEWLNDKSWDMYLKDDTKEDETKRFTIDDDGNFVDAKTGKPISEEEMSEYLSSDSEDEDFDEECEDSEEEEDEDDSDETDDEEEDTPTVKPESDDDDDDTDYTLEEVLAHIEEKNRREAEAQAQNESVPHEDVTESDDEDDSDETDDDEDVQHAEYVVITQNDEYVSIHRVPEDKKEETPSSEPLATDTVVDETKDETVAGTTENVAAATTEPEVVPVEKERARFEVVILGDFVESLRSCKGRDLKSVSDQVCDFVTQKEGSSETVNGDPFTLDENGKTNAAIVCTMGRYKISMSQSEVMVEGKKYRHVEVMIPDINLPFVAKYDKKRLALNVFGIQNDSIKAQSASNGMGCVYFELNGYPFDVNVITTTGKGKNSNKTKATVEILFFTEI